MKLYRGLKSGEFERLSREVQDSLRQNWKPILHRRSRGDLSFPKDLSQNIKRLVSLVRLQDQYFTDNRSIAEGYARTNGGLLVEIKPSMDDLLEHFKVEFQNFSKRSRQFELVYRTSGLTLSKMSKRWKLKTLSF